MSKAAGSKGFRDFDLSAVDDDLSIAPQPRKPNRDEREAINAAAEANGFTNRQPPPQLKRRKRSPFTEPFSHRVKPETLTLFRQIADQQEWSGAETLDEAIRTLAEKLGLRSPPA